MPVKNNDEDWDLDRIMTAEKVNAGGMRGKMRALQEKYCSANVEVPADMMAVVALPKQSLDLKRQVAKRK